MLVCAVEHWREGSYSVPYSRIIHDRRAAPSAEEPAWVTRLAAGQLARVPKQQHRRSIKADHAREGRTVVALAAPAVTVNPEDLPARVHCDDRAGAAGAATAAYQPAGRCGSSGAELALAADLGAI